MYRRSGLLLSLASTLALFLLPGCGDDPTSSQPPPSGASWRLVETGIGNTVQGLATNDSLIVAVGDGGIIYTSEEGRTWKAQQEFGPNDDLKDVVWFKDRYIAVGFNGTNTTSTKGIVWTANNPLGSHLFAIEASDTLAVTVGINIWTTTDGLNWRAALPLDLGAPKLYDVVYTGKIWVAAGDSMIFVSEDAVDWVQQTVDNPEPYRFRELVAVDSTVYALWSIVGTHDYHVRRSTDGLSWPAWGELSAWYLWDMAWTGTEFIAVGEGSNYHLGIPDGIVLSSPDGHTWDTVPAESPYKLTTVCQIDSMLIAAGSGGYILSGDIAQNLEVRSSGANITGVVWTGAQFKAVTAEGTVMSSSDGENWSEYHSGVSNGFERLAYSGARYVTVGGLGIPTDIYSSSDGRSWDVTRNYDGNFLQDIVWGGGQFVVVGQNGTVYTSVEATSWDQHYVGDSVTLTNVIWDGNRYVASTFSQVYFSTDGIGWTKPSPPPTGTEPVINRMIYHGGRYVAVGNNLDNPLDPRGKAYISTDGVNWDEYDIGQLEALHDIAWTGSRFIACGRDGGLATSANGMAWTVVDPLTSQTLTDIAVSSGRVVIVGSRRNVLVSP